jgi:hypothetical protein
VVLPKTACHRIGVSGCVLSCVLLGTVIGRAEDFRLESAGARFGFPANHSGRKFREAEAFANWNLPGGWDLGREWWLQTRLDLSAGWLGDEGDNAALMTAGPTLVFSREHLPLSLEGGISPTWLSHSEFPSKDFGMDFQFTLHVGLNWDFATHWRLSYWFEHMSNAGLAASNPGLNLHLFGLSYLF